MNEHPNKKIKKLNLQRIYTYIHTNYIQAIIIIIIIVIIISMKNEITSQTEMYKLIFSIFIYLYIESIPTVHNFFRIINNNNNTLLPDITLYLNVFF